LAVDEGEGEEEEECWLLLAERLKQLGVYRLAAAFRTVAGREGGREGGVRGIDPLI